MGGIKCCIVGEIYGRLILAGYITRMRRRNIYLRFSFVALFHHTKCWAVGRFLLYFRSRKGLYEVTS